MSDNYLRLVPSDPEWSPAPEAARRCVEMLLYFLPNAGEVASRFENSVSFFDPGANMQSISCPGCSQDAKAWWGEAMDEAWQASFSDLSIKTPCCGTHTSLNALRYDWPAAFGRFALEARNPGCPGLSQERHRAIELCLGSSLRTVWQHL